MAPAKPQVLYVSSNGLSEPHVHSQVLPYLERLSASYDFLLWTFEKPGFAEARREAVLARLENAGIGWFSLPYHRAPLGTVRDLLSGRRALRSLLRRRRFDLFHCRSYVPAELVRPVARRERVPWIFDMRGFYVDDRVEAGLLRRGGLHYDLLKRRESRLLREANHVVVLTEDARRALASGERFSARSTDVSVVPCSVELDRFHPAAPRVGGPLRIAYTGSIGGFYDLAGMAKALGACFAQRRGLRLLVASPQDTGPFRRALERAGVPAAAIETEALAPEAVPGRLRDCHAGICFLDRSFSKRAASPIKVAEYLATGLPVLVTPGTGDFEEFVERERVGVVVDPSDSGELATGVARWLELVDDPATVHRCRSVAERRFDAATGARNYGSVYKSLLARTG